MSFKIVQPVSPGQTYNIPIKNPSMAQAIKLSNGTPFDLDAEGFGTQGQEVIVAGIEVILYAKVQNSGFINITPVNNNNVTGTGVINIVVYLIGEQLPVGHWPVTIPTQTVQAKVSTVTTLVNDGSAPGTQIIESTESGSSGSNVSVLNDSTLVLQSFVAAVLTAYFKSIPSAGAGASVLQLGDVNRVVEVLGKALIDGLLVVTGDATFNGAGAGITVANQATVNGTGNNFFNGANYFGGTSTGTATAEIAANGSVQFDNGNIVSNGSGLLQAKGGLEMGTGASDFLKSGDGPTAVIDCTSATEIFINPPSNAAGHFINFATANVDRMRVGDGGPGLLNSSVLTLLAGSVSRMTGSNGTVCGAGTVITHALGATPNYVSFMMNIAQPGSGTNGVGSIGATTFTGTVGAGTSCTWSTKL